MATPRLTPVLLNDEQVAEELNNAIRIIAATENVTSKFIILDSLRKRNPEIKEIIDREIKYKATA